MESGKSPPTPSEQVSLEGLIRTPYVNILTYPHVSLRTARARISQLQGLRVTHLVFEGHTRIGRLGVLGIGTVGVVVPALSDGRLFALKIRRTDANRASMAREARVTMLANRLGIGPEVQSYSKDFLVLQLLRSQELEDWLRSLKGKGTRDSARDMVHTLLNQCRKLDIMGIDHGQLSNLRKHAVVAEGKPWIIDFESAGTARRPRNVTTAAQHLLIGGGISPRMRRTLGIRDTAPVLNLLKAYKSQMSDYSYAELLEGLKLVPS